ncbi:MAG TPA: 50S ribosomal protein L3 N(5)-glutamine methyltransferase [Coxiellaceae bacterium]|nr:50S ribosomal protein L3 N(5)-glutamine methyltransferase [Coxiellaceae bacterium]
MATIKDSELNQLPSLGDWVRKAAACFEEADLHYGHGTDNAWDEAAQLVLQILQLDVYSDDSVLKRHLSLVERRLLRDAIEQRIHTHKPLPYLTHTAWFMGLSFYVDERVLIPRSPLGEWIAKKFDPWLLTEPAKICEIGTGSGCLAIACAKTFPHAHVDAVDICADALQVAKINVERHQMQDRVKLLQSDCFDNLAEQHYDLIISNPPYVSTAEVESLPEEYQHEPRKALEAEENGLKIVLKILQQAPRYLKQKGILVMDVGYSDEALMQRLPRVPFTWLDLQQGGHGIFLLTVEELKQINFKEQNVL